MNEKDIRLSTYVEYFLTIIDEDNPPHDYTIEVRFSHRNNIRLKSGAFVAADIHDQPFYTVKFSFDGKKVVKNGDPSGLSIDDQSLFIDAMIRATKLLVHKRIYKFESPVVNKNVICLHYGDLTPIDCRSFAD